MKTNAFRYLGLALMAVLTLSLTSCEVEIDSFYDDDNIGGGYYNRSADLCSRTWVSFYRDMDGNRCRQELDFYLDRTGVDFIRVDIRILFPLELGELCTDFHSYGLRSQ